MQPTIATEVHGQPTQRTVMSGLKATQRIHAVQRQSQALPVQPHTREGCHDVRRSVTLAVIAVVIVKLP